MNAPRKAIQPSTELALRASQSQVASALKRPVIILSAPRAGSTLLFEYLTGLGGASWIGGESHCVFRQFPHLRFENQAMDSASLNQNHASSECKRRFRDSVAYLLRDSEGRRFIQDPQLFLDRPQQFIEKTPRNALNVSFLNQVFPDARFVFLHRQPQTNIASIIEAWRLGLQTGRFMTFPKLPGWDRSGWCFLLPPGWREFVGKSLAEIASFQWRLSNQTIVSDLGRLPRQRYSILSYEALLADPQAILSRLLDFMSIENDGAHDSFGLRPSTTTISPPNKHKWEKHRASIDPLLPSIELVRRSINRLVND